MPRPSKSIAASPPPDDVTPSATDLENGEAASEDGDEVVPEGQLVCRLTNEHVPATAAEETLQAFIEQLHREYRIEFADMERDFRIPCEYTDTATNRTKQRNRTVSLAVFESGEAHTVENVIRVAIIKPAA